MRELNSSFDYLSKDYKGYKQAMIERLKVLMPEYTDLSETDAGIVILELASVGLDILSAYLDSQANESLLVSAELWSSVLKWAKMLSYEPRFATPSLVEQVFKLKAVSETDTIIEAGTQISTSNVSNETPVYFETVSDLTIPAGSLGDEQDEEGNYLHTVDASQGISILSEAIGTSNGAKDQEFKLGYSPVIYNTIEIWCDGVKWTKAENNSFVNSESSNTHFTVTMSDLNEAIIVFGDNVFGKIPPKDKPIYAYYRVGGGTDGNVSPNTVNTLVQSDSRIDKTFNPNLPKEYGQDRESIKSIKLSAPALSRTTWGALTLTDFTDLILANFPEVKLAKTIRGDTSANYGITEDTTCDDLVVAVVTDTGENISYEASSELQSKILKEFEVRKLAGINEIYFAPVNPVTQVSIEVQASLLSGYSNKEQDIAKDIFEAIVHFFEIGSIQMDETLDVSKIEAFIQKNVTGLNFARIKTLCNYNLDEVENPYLILPLDNSAFNLFVVDRDTTNCHVSFLETGHIFEV